MDRISRINFHLGLLVLPALLGMAVLIFATGRGPAVGGDATVYILSAKNLVEGNGLGIPGPDGSFRYLSHYPPLFPLVLAGLGYIGFDFIEAARYLNGVLFSLMIMAAGFTFYKATGCIIFSLVSQLLFLVSPILIFQYAWAMAEPLNIFLGFAALLLLLAYFRRPVPGFWLLSALAAGLAGLTRLIGAAFVLVGGVLILGWGKGNWKRRFASAFLYLAAGSFPMLLWSILDYRRTASFASRRLGATDFLTAPAEHLLHIARSFQSVFESWLVPASWVAAPPYPAFLNGLLLLCAAAVAGLSLGAAIWMTVKQQPGQWTRDPAAVLLVSLLVFVVLYLLLAVFLYITVLPRIDLNNRMLLPAHAASLGAFLLTGYLLIRSIKSWRWMSIPVYAVFLGVIGMYGFRSVRIVADLHQYGAGYLGKEWQQSDTILAVRNLPPDTILISNEEAALLFFTGRAVYPVMEFYDLHPADQMTSFGESTVDDVQKVFREEGAALVLFNTMHGQLADLYGERAELRVEILTYGLYPFYEGQDGSIYFYNESGNE